MADITLLQPTDTGAESLVIINGNCSALNDAIESVVGTVVSVAVVPANGFSGTVADPTTTPAITIIAGAITPTSVNSVVISGSSTPTLAVTGTTTVSGSNTGDQTNISGNAATVTTNANLTGPITSSGNATSIASQTGTGTKFVVDTSPTLVTPVLGVATATSINKVAITQPSSSATLTIADGKSLTVNNILTLAGTDSTVMTFPSTSATIARTDAANTFTGIQTVTNVTLPTNGQILLTVPTTDGHATGFTTNAFNSGYSSTAVGDLMYLDSSSTWQKTDANTLLLYNGLLGIALSVAASGAAPLVALPGSFVYATGFPTFTIGLPIYMSETAGAVTQTQPSTTDAAIRIIGWGVHADKMYFNPSGDYVTHT